MYENIKRLHHDGQLTAIGLDNAIKKGWITEEQKLEIIESKVESSGL